MLQLCIFHMLFFVTCTPGLCAKVVDGYSNQEVSFLPCTQRVGQFGLEVDCSRSDITNVSRSWFPKNLTQLNLSFNKISLLQSGTFTNLTQLIWLDVSNNLITTIQPDTFNTLHKLRYLYLAGNPLTVSPSSFPRSLLSRLALLQTLTIPGMSDAHGNLELPEVCSSPQLRRLDIVGGDVNRISNYSFMGLDCLELQNLTLKNMGNLAPEGSSLKPTLEGGIDEDALAPVSNSLQSFTLWYVFVGLQLSLKVLKPLQHRNMTEIKLHQVGVSSWSNTLPIKTQDGILTARSAKYLKNICVERFEMIEAHIALVDEHFITNNSIMASCLRHLDMSHNLHNMNDVTLFNVLKFPRIESFILIDRDVPSYAENYTMMQTDGVHDKTPHLLQLYGKRTRKTIFQKYTTGRTKSNTQNSYSVYVSKTLKTIEFAFTHESNYRTDPYVSNRMDQTYIIKNAHRLTDFACRFCGLYSATGNVLGLESMKNLDLSYNDLFNMSPHFLDNLTTIETLVLSHTNLHPRQMSVEMHLLFRTFINLTMLDVTSNSLYSMSKQTFETNNKLKILILTDNKFSNVPFDVDFTPQLRLLDLRKNTILQIDEKERRKFDNHVVNVPDFQILLQDNTLSCDCDTIPFLTWLHNTKVHLDRKGNYTCVMDGHVSYTSLHTDGKVMWRMCHGQTYLLLSIILLILILQGFSATLLALRHGHYIRAVFFSVFVQDFKQKTRDDYAIDVFLGYAEQDYEFPCRQLMPFLEQHLGLTTYLRDRDSLPGDDVASSIMDAVTGSWRVILVVTPAFLDTDQWAEFTMRSAVYSQSPRDPARVMVLVSDDVRRDVRGTHRLPRYLLAAVADCNIVDCVTSQGGVGSYELKQALRTFLLR